MTEAYDQIAIIKRDPRLPGPEKNSTAGTQDDDFDFGVVNFVRLFQDAVANGQSVKNMSMAKKTKFIGLFEYDVSDHMPIWIRLAKP